MRKHKKGKWLTPNEEREVKDLLSRGKEIAAIHWESGIGKSKLYSLRAEFRAEAARSLEQRPDRSVQEEAISILLGHGYRPLLEALPTEILRRQLARVMYPPWMLDENGELPGGAWDIVERQKCQPGYKGF